MKGEIASRIHGLIKNIFLELEDGSDMLNISNRQKYHRAMELFNSTLGFMIETQEGDQTKLIQKRDATYSEIQRDRAARRTIASNATRNLSEMLNFFTEAL